jgi:hypothetical protein
MITGGGLSNEQKNVKDKNGKVPIDFIHFRYPGLQAVDGFICALYAMVVGDLGYSDAFFDC